MGSQKSHSSEIDIGHLMEILCGIREEEYPFQRYVALLTFSTWLGWPFALHIVELGQTVAAARVILAIHEGEIKVTKTEREQVIHKISNNVFDPLTVARALAEPYLECRFREAFDEFNMSLWNVAAVASFIIQCPLEKKPSLNKAFFFIEEGGYEKSLTIERRGLAKPYKMSTASLKKSWESLAVTSPFALTAINMFDDSMFCLPPDGEGSIKGARKLLKKVETFKEFFSRARNVQEDLFSRLDKNSRDKLMFVEFPESIAAAVIGTNPLRDDQLAIIDRYRAPVFLPKEKELAPKSK